MWHENGNLRAEGNLTGEGIPAGLNSLSKREGLWRIYDEDGKLEETEYWKDGERLMEWGIVSTIDSSKEMYYQNNYGEKNGPATCWHPNGQKVFAGNLKDDKLMSAEAWKPNGEKCPVTNVKEGNGVVVWYKDDGMESLRLTYKDGKPVK